MNKLNLISLYAIKHNDAIYILPCLRAAIEKPGSRKYLLALDVTLLNWTLCVEIKFYSEKGGMPW